MVNKEQFMNGILTYIDKEVIPVLPTAGKWGIGTVVLLVTDKYSRLFDEITSNPIIKSIGIVDTDGNVDVERLSEALKISADKYGKMTLSIPIIGNLTFTSSDVEKVKHYINGGVS